MRLWLERFVIPICAAIVFGLSILNPLKMDWPQRVSLAVAIAGFAYFAAHTLHRTAAATDPNQEIKSSLQVQQQEIDSLKQQLAANALESRQQEEERKKRRLAIRNQLGVFLDEGKTLQQEIEYSNLNAPNKKADWEKRVEKYLEKELDASYAARFRSPLRVPLTYPEAMAQKQAALWTDVTEKIGALNTFISELRD